MFTSPYSRFACTALLAASAAVAALPRRCAAATPAPRRVIIFVWDGLRPDSVTTVDTPTLKRLAEGGVWFEDNHSTYPTFTMMNGASLATGGFPGRTGFYGNTLWQPGPTGNNSAGAPVDYQQPVFTEDYAILKSLNSYYGDELFEVGTLFAAAQARGLTTAAIGKSGPAFLQDLHQGGCIVDEKAVFPLSLAKELQVAGIPLPTAPLAYPAGALTLAAGNGNPVAAAATSRMIDGVTTDPTSTAGSQSKAANQYLMNVYLTYVLPQKKPDLSLIWIRNPDSTEHSYGPGSANYRDALHAQDGLLGQLLDALATLGLGATTDVIVVSDHGHSTVSGPANLFPLRGVNAGAVAGVDAAGGFSVSGDVRSADLLTRAGFKAFDGNGCAYDPVLSGIKADGSPVYPTLTDTDGSVCGQAGKKYTTASFKVPATLPAGAVVIAANGGSDYFYVPDHDPAVVRGVVRRLQSREEFGALFVAGRYGAVPGTLPLDDIRLENAAGRNPDIVASYAFDEHAKVQGMPGTEFESMQTNRGMHGSFSPFDVHNTLIAAGPDFLTNTRDPLPSGNVDVAPTVAAILGLPLPQAQGRALTEALHGAGALRCQTLSPGRFPETPRLVCRTAAAHDTPYLAWPEAVESEPATGLNFELPTDPAGGALDGARSQYSVLLRTRLLRHGGRSHLYFDSAAAVRQ